ncbi:hypothetical protein BerOc1_01405 [Pseudodesulfovibrio hydrargyri]|uniref:Uncharacterized protein n=1 Tax=Pseudodesulfovibrio hydrargyri TaxID=2125990 RepID=A0A1J5N3S6_9BACT|nr:hypothetical protein [Pseudodesulfovibrio hydrargyri]OIQ49480.1 hypothetical protein BerOc1_01405 [Pseudodesulfovibrio hydrargyri]
MLDQELLSSLPPDPMLAIGVLYEKISGKRTYAATLEGFYVFKSYCEKMGLKFQYPMITGDQAQITTKIAAFYTSILPQIKEYEVAAKIDSYLIKPVKITAKDKKEIQSILNTLRDRIKECDEIEDDFKHRLLVKVNELQSELDKPTSDLDMALGKAVKIGLTIEKLCNNTKPLLEPLSKIFRVLDRVTSNHEGLPPSNNLSLPYGPEDTTDEKNS